MTLAVLSIAFPFAPVGPHSVGGAEQILGNLDAALVARRHTSLVIAREDSRLAGELIPIHASADRSATWNEVRLTAERTLSTRRVDLVHMHGCDFHQYLPLTDIPVLVTLHMPIDWYPLDIWTKFGPNVHFQCVSHSQRRRCPPHLRDVSVIENGVDIPSPHHTAKGHFALALGRICPEKNVHAALEAGTLAHTPVLIGGEVFPYPNHERYFEEQVKPLLSNHEFLGPLQPDRKQQLLSEAKCLLHPTLAPETSSLVAMEAMAAGAPVIAYRSGALPDIVEDGITGFLVNNVQEMAAAIPESGKIDPETCRNVARRRFSKQDMLNEYFRLYHHMNARRISNHSHDTPARSACA